MVATTISHKGELITLMEKLIRNVMEDASEEILEIFKEKYITKYVYVGTPEVYPRTYEFRESWKFSEIKKLADVLETTMSLDWGSMTSDAGSYIHSSYSPFGQDSRPFIEKILNYDGSNMPSSGATSSHLWSKLQGQPYWDIFIREMFQGGKLRRIIDKHAKARGITPVMGVSI